MCPLIKSLLAASVACFLFVSCSKEQGSSGDASTSGSGTKAGSGSELSAIDLDTKIDQDIAEYESFYQLSEEFLLSSYLSQNPLFYPKRDYSVTVNWNPIKKYVTTPPRLFLLKDLSIDMQKLLDEGVLLFDLLTGDPAKQNSLFDAEGLASAFPARKIGSYQSFWGGLDANGIPIIQKRSSARDVDINVDERFYNKFRNRFKHLQLSNLSQALRSSNLDIKQYLSINEVILEGRSSSAYKGVVATINWIERSYRPFEADLLKLEDFVQESSTPAYKLRRWNKYYDNKGTRLMKYVSKNASAEYVFEEDATVWVAEEESYLQAVVVFQVKQWSLLVAENPNPLAKITRSDRLANSPPPRAVEFGDLELRVLNKKKYGGYSYRHEQKRNEGDRPFTYDCPGYYYLRVQDVSSALQLWVQVSSSAYDRAVPNEVLDEQFYPELKVVEAGAFPEKKLPNGFYIP